MHWFTMDTTLWRKRTLRYIVLNTSLISKRAIVILQHHTIVTLWMCEPWEGQTQLHLEITETHGSSYLLWNSIRQSTGKGYAAYRAIILKQIVSNLIVLWFSDGADQWRWNHLKAFIVLHLSCIHVWMIDVGSLKLSSTAVSYSLAYAC